MPDLPPDLRGDRSKRVTWTRAEFDGMQRRPATAEDYLAAGLEPPLDIVIRDAEKEHRGT